MQKITPFLWYDNQAEEAATFYVSIFDNSKIVDVARYGEGGPGPEGTAITVAFELGGQSFVALNGGPQFKFTEAVSFVINCKDQEEVDRFWDALAEGGTIQECGWLKDRYGLSWQVIPTVLSKLLGDSDPAKAGRVMGAMLQMKKIEIKDLEEAYAG
ncbi:MAG: VOC family protein [Dehalococcoidia bacterium]|nr:VOC family protein [Dehalococcoidia bacterium]